MDDSFDPNDRDTVDDVIDHTVVNFRTLDTADAETVWTELREFTQWLLTRYKIKTAVIPDCWYEHAPIVEELSALHSAHTVLFDPADGGLGPITFQEKLNAALTRIKTTYQGDCTRGHNDVGTRVWTIDEQAWTQRTRLPFH